MQVRGDHIFVYHALVPGFPGIAKPVKHLAERGMVPDIGPPAMVLESYHRLLEKRAVEHDISDQPLRLPLCRDIQDPQPFDGLFVRPVIFSQELITPADCQHNAAVLYICLKILPDVF